MSDDHPCWPECQEQTASLLAGTAPAFERWLASVTVAGVRYGPTRTFQCDAGTQRPRRWASGDAITADDLNATQSRLPRDPSKPNQRCEGHTTVAALTIGCGTRDGSAAADRLTPLVRHPSAGRGR